MPAAGGSTEARRCCPTWWSWQKQRLHGPSWCTSTEAGGRPVEPHAVRADGVLRLSNTVMRHDVKDQDIGTVSEANI